MFGYDWNAKGYKGLCFRRHNTTSKEDYKITYYLYNHKIIYNCNGFFFNQHIYVVEYYKKLLSGKIKNRNKKPKGALGCKYLDPYAQFYKIAECKYPDMLKSNPFSDVIYKRVWFKCDYDCFSADNFRLLKQGYVAEMNEYRRLHDTSPLIVHPVLEILANELARKSCYNILSLFKRNPHIGYILKVTHVSLADFVITKMYDKFLTNYNWNAKQHIGKYDKYAQILWLSTKKVGVGVCIKHKKIHVALLFSPLGCTKNFKTNVRPIGWKHIHMFAVFGRNRAK
uniref:SCP domain-containing protein n=1 Tax=Strongyloides venezuelensis TaxID=75913 RepID=A0A0K0FJA9_STRVS